MNKVFQILVPDNTLVSRIISCENQVTELFVIDRYDKNFVSEYSTELNKPALYILINRDKRQLYVGETDDSVKRLRNHEAKDFWTEAIVFHSTGNTLSTTEVKWLEAKTYEALKELGYYDLSENKQVPQQPPLKRNQIYTLEPIFEEAKNYICAAGFDIFLKKKENKGQAIQQDLFNSQPVEAIPTSKVDTAPYEGGDKPRLFSKPTLVSYLRNINSEKTRGVMRSIGIMQDISAIKDLSVLDKLHSALIDYEKKKGIHHTHSCAISRYMDYIKAGLAFEDMVYDVQLVKEQKNISSRSHEVPVKKIKHNKPRKGNGAIRAAFKFEMVGLKRGDKIVFDALNLIVTVLNDNTIEYAGNEYTLSGFCKRFLPENIRNTSGAYQGPKYFSYQGKTLWKIRLERERIIKIN